MPILGQIDYPRHRCKPEHREYPEHTAFQCDTCGRLWVLEEDERGKLSWTKPTWWQRGKIRKMIAVRNKTVVGDQRGHAVAAHSERPPRASAVPPPPPQRTF